MLNKGVTSIDLNSAKSHNELERFLTSITQKFLGSVSDYPLVMQWLQEVTKKADLKYYAEWYEYLSTSGKAFKRLDQVLLAATKNSAGNNTPVWKYIHNIRMEMERFGKCITGLQAILLMREFFKETDHDTMRIE